MSFLTRFSLKNASAIVILCLLIVFGGIYSTTKIRQETMPDMNFPIVSVITAYPGAAPNDVRNNITKPYENLILGIEGIETVSSTSSENISAIIVQFDFSANMDDAQRKVEEAVKAVKLPDGAMETKVSRFNFNSMPILNISVSNKDLSSYELEQRVRKDIVPGLSAITGVADVQLSSDTKKSVNIKLIPSKLKEYNMTSQQVVQLLNANNVEFPAGSVNMNNTVEPVRITGKVNSVDDLKNLEILVMPKAAANTNASQQGTVPAMPQTIRLSDLADVTLDTGAVTSFSRTNGNPSIMINILKTQDANTVNVSDAAKTKIDELKSSLPENTKVETVNDQADNVKESVNGMVREGLLGALFAFLVILLFLRNIRTTLIAIVSIPLSVLITLIFLKQFNITLNILTLGALSVATGRIVDDAIVVIENIYRHLHTDTVRNVDLIKLAAKEVTKAITSSTLATVAVFVPIALVSGFAGVMFRPFAITVAVALLSSLFVAVTVIPVMSKVLLLKAKKIKHEDFHEGKLMKKYGNLLSWSLNHKIIVLLIALALFVGSLGLLPFIGTSFIPEAKAKNIDISINYPAGTAVETINSKAEEIEKILAKNSEVVSYRTTVALANASNPLSALMAGSPGNISAKLKADTDVDTLIKSLSKELTKKADKATIDI
jgi:hydrophobic/amphiphilic exporter-1 (mainly G- bacteria), HAE1 family